MEADQQSIKSLIGHYLEIIWRRKYCLALFPLLAVFALYYALSLPPVYQSEGVILVENQNIPPDLIRTTVTSYAAQQIAVIRQQIESTGNVMNLVEKYGLYPRLSKEDSLVIAERFRENLDVITINADIMDPGSGRQRTVSIAFRVSFQDESPQLAQQVASEVIQLFLEQNTLTRKREAASTASFLRGEADVLQTRVVSLEDQIAEFKSENADSLPELLEYNLSVISSSEDRLRQNEVSIDNLVEQEQLLSIELRSMDPYTGMVAGAASTNAPQGGAITASAQLAQKKAQLSQLVSRYSDSHPSVQALRRDIATLEAEINLVAVGRGELYGEGEINEEDRLFSPVYLELRYRIGRVERDISSLNQENVELKNQITEYNARIAKTYVVQREFDELQREYESTYGRYEELRRAQYEAEVAQSLEEGSQSESLRLMETPQVPLYPIGPERPKVLVLGLGFAMAICVGIGALLEMVDDRIYGQRSLRSVTGQAPLVVVPFIRTADDVRRKRQLRVRWIWGALALIVLLIVIALAYVHFFVVDLRTLDAETLSTMFAS